MASPVPAIFISYAREDTDAARRIADALRAFGVEVWFDQAELRGGDAWDAKIKKQIRECTLFIPVISARTQARHEGYFRREWKLAVERTQDMAASRAFLVPVVIDDTPESQAEVPEEFMRVQWTRLAHGVPSPQFVEQIKRLLTPGSTMETGRPRPVERGGGATSPSKKRVPFWLWLGGAVVLGGIVAFFVARKSPSVAAQGSTPTSEKSAVAPRPASDKSIAVLPFANMSDDKDASAFFANGIHEDILTNLAHIRELRVVSRTSVEQYRDTKKTMRQIGQELNVAYLLEGSVRRTGNKVRVTGQLIRAASDEHVWAKNYDRDLTDVFAIQAALATEIGAELKATLSPQEKTLITQSATRNVEAYDLYLKAREIDRKVTNQWSAGLADQESLLQAAVTLDAKFAEAWAELARVHGLTFFLHREHSAARQAKAQMAIEKALALAPDLPEVIANVGYYHLYAHRDYARATAEFERLARLQPNNSVVYFSLGEIQWREGKWLPALANLRKATELDPGNLSYARDLVRLLRGGRRWAEAIAEQRRIVSLAPNNLSDARELAMLPFHASDSRREMEALLASLPPEGSCSKVELEARAAWAQNIGDYATAIRLAAAAKREYIGEALTLAAHGQMADARAAVTKILATARQRLEREPNNAVTLWTVGLAEAVLGNKAEALRCAQRSVELLPESRDAVLGADLSNKLALIYAWAGETDRAIEETARLLKTPNSVADVHMMKYDPWWFPLRSDPRFMALLNDPKNNAPLF